MNLFSADSRESNAEAGWAAGLKKEEGDTFHNLTAETTKPPRSCPPVPSESESTAVCCCQESSWCRGVGVGGQLVTSSQHRANKLYIKASCYEQTSTDSKTCQRLVCCLFEVCFFLNSHKLQHSITGQMTENIILGK